VPPTVAGAVWVVVVVAAGVAADAAKKRSDAMVLQLLFDQWAVVDVISA
jgi:hypothetical protein